MTDAADKSPSSWQLSDIRELAQLLTQALPATVQITEAVHQAVLGGMGIKGREKGKTAGLTGLIYKGVHGAANSLGSGINDLLARLPLPTQPSVAETPKRAALLATLNGVLGDKLVEQQNALATPMTLRYQGKPLDWKDIPADLPHAGRVLLMIHGLCMNDLQWHTSYEGKSVNHGEAVAGALGYLPIYLRYNSGLSIASNGQALALQLEDLCDRWPGAIKQLSVLAYSMGGLVIRSACHYAQTHSLRWPKRLRHLIFLGTPHHGAPLESAGHWLEQLLPVTPYSMPFVKLTRIRSQGIRDLRHGKVIDASRNNKEFTIRRDPRQPLPLPSGVACFAIAGTTSAKRTLLAERLIGDGLVPLRSALGLHRERAHQLDFPPEHTLIAYRTTHMALLGSPEVGAQLLDWLDDAR
ncbi:esterase/lipase family protein [Aeromonas veronii]|uniref:esterase/lipase family protein n=1 Tax=Aeromonas veronii TaxID=654 RepID=UPI001F3EBFE3|nr:alpha/beta hydrolase [Aeromonas veronii]MCF7742160.1 alpha/beta hydrolase [Aeromonas veronii]MCF7743953.1 alpha/beta hydrolase [Aeromonas veronii]